MALQHIADGTGLLVVAAAALHAQRLGHCDLHVIHVATVPQRLEDAVDEAQHKDVLDRLLAQIVIDAVDLGLVEDLVDTAVEGARGLQIAPERLLHDHPRPAALLLWHVEAGRTEVTHHVDVGGGWYGQVEEAVIGRASRLVEVIQRLGQAPEARRVVVAAGHVGDVAGEPVPDVVARAQARGLQGVAQALAKLSLVAMAAPEADDGQLLGQQVTGGQAVEGGHQLAMGQVAGGAEDHQRQRLRHLLPVDALLAPGPLLIPDILPDVFVNARNCYARHHSPPLIRG